MWIGVFSFRGLAQKGGDQRRTKIEFDELSPMHYLLFLFTSPQSPEKRKIPAKNKPRDLFSRASSLAHWGEENVKPIQINRARTNGLISTSIACFHISPTTDPGFSQKVHQDWPIEGTENVKPMQTDRISRFLLLFSFYLSEKREWVGMHQYGQTGYQSDWVPVRLSTGPTEYRSDWVPGPDWVFGPDWVPGPDWYPVRLGLQSRLGDRSDWVSFTSKYLISWYKMNSIISNFFQFIETTWIWWECRCKKAF